MALASASTASGSILKRLHRERPSPPSGNEAPARQVDVKALQRALADSLEGEVRFDRGSIGLYATDSSNFREIPLGPLGSGGPTHE